MAEESRPIRIREEIASLQLPPEDLWVRTPARRGVGPQLAIAVAVALVLVAISFPLAGQLDQRRNAPGAAIGSPSLVPARTAPAVPSTPTTCVPGTSSLGGRLVRFLGNSLIVDTVERGEVAVDISSVIEVWRETTVEPSSLQPGDDLMIDGTPGTPFVALHIYANIGRIDGVVRAIDVTGMTVEVRAGAGGTRLQRIDFSPFIEYGAPGQPLSRADLVVGKQIGAVLYDAPGETPRATRIWW